MDKEGVWIVIAAYNEEKSIAKVVQELKGAGYEQVIVVDDGSKDATFEMASKQKVKVIRHEINQGQGAALRTGIHLALQNGAREIVTFDADGQHRIEDLSSMIEPVQKKEVDITLGSRFIGETSKIPFIRKLFLKGGVVVIWLFYGVKLTDAHNGFRCFSRHAAESIEIKSDRFEHASEIISEIQKKKISYREVPVVVSYTDYAKSRGQSSWNAFRILYKMVLHKFAR